MDIQEFEDFLSRHERVALQFSSGKDSAACLRVLKPYLDRITLLWANTGDAYPETLEYMDKVYSEVPHFVEVNGEQPSWVIEHGMPVDVMPVSASAFAPMMHQRNVPLLQPFNACCTHNMWEPMAEWLMHNQVTGLIRGQKTSDSLGSSFRSGDKIGNIELFYPIVDMTDEEVLEFLGDDVPDSYKRGLHSSLDCRSCSAYVSHNAGRLADLDLIYPPAAARIRTIHSFLREELSSHLKDLEV